jgi:hypothetical protein
MAMSILFLIVGMKGFALANYGMSTFILGFCMAGAPIIIMAFNGVLYRNEAQVRLYLYYMWITIAILVCLIVKECILSGPCQHLSGIFSTDGAAWACGVARYLNLFIIFVCLSMLGYFQHVVYSYCEDLTECGGGPELGDLVLNRDFYNKRQDHSLYSTIEGLAEAGENGNGGWMTSTVPEGLSGGTPIFGGKYHEMAYPPRGMATH